MRFLNILGHLQLVGFLAMMTDIALAGRFERSVKVPAINADGAPSVPLDAEGPLTSDRGLDFKPVNQGPIHIFPEDFNSSDPVQPSRPKPGSRPPFYPQGSYGPPLIQSVPRPGQGHIHFGDHSGGPSEDQQFSAGHPQVPSLGHGGSGYGSQGHYIQGESPQTVYPQGYEVQGHPVQGFPQGYPNIGIQGRPVIYPALPVYYPGSGIVLGALGPPLLYPTYPTTVGTGGVELIPVGALGGNSVVVIPIDRQPEGQSSQVA